MKVYLADLAHDYFKSAQFTPTNIGFIGAYAKQQFKDDVEVTLFKSLDKLLDAADNIQPDILGLSNYTWNSGLVSFASDHFKNNYPHIPIVAGGPNIRIDEEGIELYLRNNPNIDKYIMFAGEVAFNKILQHMFNQKGSGLKADDLRRTIIDGCYSLNNENLEGNMNYKILDDLDEIPSPYLNGMMDPFLQEGFLPIVETNRGCPFTCTFCVWGISAMNKVRKFSMERVKSELDYIVHSTYKVPVITFGDANFGILRRDLEIAQHVRKLYEETKSFSRVQLYWAKVSKPHIVEIGRVLGHLTQTYVAFQSLDPQVLVNIKRRNIRTDELVKLIDQLQNFTDAAQTDILVGLPGETYASHLRSLDSALDLGINLIHGGEIRMLPGSEMDSKESRKQFGLKTKFRLFEGGYGVYRNQFVYELEEGVRATSTMSEDEMLTLRVLRAFFYASVTLGEHLPLASYLRDRGIVFTQVCEKMVEVGLKHPVFGPTVEWLINCSRNEWHDSKEDAALFISNIENQTALLKDSMFVKLNTGFLALIYMNMAQYEAYYQVLKAAISDLDSQVSEVVLDELIHICRERNYLVKCLQGVPNETQLALPISGETLEALRSARFIGDDQIQEGRLHLEIDKNTAQFCREFVRNHSEMNHMQLSQMLLLQAGRFLMKQKKNYLNIPLSESDLISLPQEVA
jgi:radical SAM superfamily enzyme YgiQ (UPF0313 family)